MKLSFSRIREYLFYLLIFILPWQTRWIIRDPYLGGEVWEYGRISLYSWDILLFILAALSWRVIWEEIKNVKIKNQNTKFLIPNSRVTILSNPFTIYVLFLIYTLFSILWSPDTLLALVWSLRLFEGGLLWLLARAIKPKWPIVCWSLVTAGTAQAGWAIIQFITQASFANKWLGVAVHPLTQGGTSVVMNEHGRWLRAYAGQVHPNVLGGLLVITLLATVYLYVVKKSEIPAPPAGRRNLKSDTNPTDQNSEKISFRFQVSGFTTCLLPLLYIIQLVGLFFTFSRGAWLALFISLIFLWWRESSCRRLVNQIILLSSLVIIILGAIYWQPLSGRFTGQSTLEQQSIEDRQGSIKQSSQLLSSKWLLGTGIGNYTAQLATDMPGLIAWRYQPVHNIFLLIFTELGIVGLILFLLLLWRAVKPLIRLSGPPPVGWIGASFLVAVLVTSQFDHYWWTAPSMFLLLWLIITLNININTTN